jgi:hypothetical protein
MKLITFIRFYYLSICKGVSVSDVFCVDVWIQFTYYRLNIGYCYSDLGMYLHDYEITKFTKPLLVWANENSSNFCSMLLLFMSVGWDYDPELQPPTSLLFFPLVIYDYGEPLWKDINRAKPKNSEKVMFQCNFVHHKSHIDWPGCEPWPLRWEASD